MFFFLCIIPAEFWHYSDIKLTTNFFFIGVKILRNVCRHFHELPDKFLMNFYSFFWIAFEWIFDEQGQQFLADIWKDFLKNVKKFLVAFWCAFADIRHSFIMAICWELHFSFLSCSSRRLFDRCLTSNVYNFWWTFWRFLLLFCNDFLTSN